MHCVEGSLKGWQKGKFSKDRMDMRECVCAHWLSRVQLFCKLMDCSLPGSYVHEILQATTLEWVAISFSRGSSRPRDGTHVSCINRWLLYHWAVGEAQTSLVLGKSGWLAPLSAVQTGMNILSCHSEPLKLIQKREMVVCRKVLCFAELNVLNLSSWHFALRSFLFSLSEWRIFPFNEICISSTR